MLREETVQMIPCKLGDSEIRQRGCDLAGELENLESLRAEKKSLMRQLKEREDEMCSKIARIREVVKTGIEAIEQPCFKVFDVENKKIWWELLDGSRYHEREMRDDELGKGQKTLFDNVEDVLEAM
jgi:hypothetical protein